MKNKTLWIYTGFTMDELERMNMLEKMNMVDVIVDGPYIEELRDITLPFIGSSNQKINRMR